MAEIEPATVKTETVKAPVWVPDPVLTLVLAGLLIGLIGGVVLEKRGYLDGLSRKPDAVITDGTEIERRLLKIIDSKCNSLRERWDDQEAALRAYVNANTCHCRWRGAVGDHPVGDAMPVGAAPPPPKK